MVGFVLKYIGIGGVVALAVFLLVNVYWSPASKVLAPPAEEERGEIIQEVAVPVATSTAVVEERSVPSNGARLAPTERPVEVKKEIFTPPSLPKIELPQVKVATATPVLQPPPPPLPPLDERAILQAVVKIECPTEDGLGKYIGSGFALAGDIIVTAAHVLKNSGRDTCTVIFPKDRRPIYYLRGTTENLKEVTRRHDEEGIDVAIIKLPVLENYSEARAIFPEYPFIPYPICENPAMLGDILLHFGYPSNYLDQNYLSRLEGEAAAYADIAGIRDQLSQDQTFTYKSPIFSTTGDQSKLHPYMVSRVASFYGDSGGLAFNATAQCILGPHRGGTIGKSPGENFSVFMVLGWEKAKSLLPQ